MQLRSPKRKPPITWPQSKRRGRDPLPLPAHDPEEVVGRGVGLLMFDVTIEWGGRAGQRLGLIADDDGHEYYARYSVVHQGWEPAFEWQREIIERLLPSSNGAKAA